MNEIVAYQRKRQRLITYFRCLRKARYHKTQRAVRRALAHTCHLLSMQQQEMEVIS